MKLKPAPRRIPRFRSGAEERQSWQSHDSAGYLGWSTARLVTFPDLHPSSKTISLRLPVSRLDAVRREANQRDVPDQSLMKVWLAEKVEPERPRAKRHLATA
jgi:predicted DNA binding CopG/RHH family protein